MNHSLFLSGLILIIVILVQAILTGYVSNASNALKASNVSKERFNSRDNADLVSVVFQYQDVVSVNSMDPFFEYNAKQKLLDNFMLKTNAHLNMCLNESCNHLIEVPSSKALDKRSVFMMTELSRLPRVVDEEKASKASNASNASNTSNAFTEYLSQYGSIPFKVTVLTKMPLNVKLTLDTCKSYIQEGTIRIWFDTSEKIRNEFMLYLGDTFVNWSLNKVEPDIECNACDKVVFRIVPRHAPFVF